MTDVARRAGVSQSSVSLVLNFVEGARISEETRRRVMTAARELGYELPGARRAERLERSVVAFVVDDLRTSPDTVSVLRGVREAAQAAGYMTAAYLTQGDATLEAGILGLIAQDIAVLGVIFATADSRDVSDIVPQLKKPAILFNCSARDSGLFAIRLSEMACSFAATTALTNLGHEQIGLVNGPAQTESSRERLKGYRQALATAELPFDAAWVREGEETLAGGREAAGALLALANRPTALVCANDLAAAGALLAAGDLGLQVPGDVSIIGHDDLPFTSLTHPPLSTIALPLQEAGRQAADTLIDLAVNNRTPRARTIRIDGELVMRGTTAPPAGLREG